MTLVVGCATPDIGFMVADTLLGFAFDLKGRPGLVNGESHALKIQILNPAVAFAGDVETSLHLIRDLHTALSTDLTINPCELLCTSYGAIAMTSPSPDCEFLVLQLTADGKKQARITRDGVFNAIRAFTGDAAKYNSLKGLEGPYSGPNGATGSATRWDLPHNAARGDRGGSRIRCRLRCHGSFDSPPPKQIRRGDRRVRDPRCSARISGEVEYLQSIEASLTPWEGNSGFSLLASNSCMRGIGIYYRSGKKWDFCLWSLTVSRVTCSALRQLPSSSRSQKPDTDLLWCVEVGTNSRGIKCPYRFLQRGRAHTRIWCSFSGRTYGTCKALISRS
jgi:hypothetical protein